MTTTLNRPAESSSGKAKKTRKPKDSVLTGGLPQVNLLPPEVKAARGLRVVKRWLAISLVVVLVLLGLAYTAAVLARSDAEAALESAQAETARLRAQEATYAEVPIVLGALQATQQARELGMSTEVGWKPYLDAITAVLPENTSIETVAFEGADPVTLPAPPVSPLHQPAVGTLTFTGRTLAVPQTADWIDALDAVPGFQDTWVESTVVAAEDGTTYYEFRSTVAVTADAYALRFVPEED
jgi:Tfp pilus assembly protein PilN